MVKVQEGESRTPQKLEFPFYSEHVLYCVPATTQWTISRTDLLIIG